MNTKVLITTFYFKGNNCPSGNFKFHDLELKTNMIKLVKNLIVCNNTFFFSKGDIHQYKNHWQFPLIQIQLMLNDFIYYILTGFAFVTWSLNLTLFHLYISQLLKTQQRPMWFWYYCITQYSVYFLREQLFAKFILVHKHFLGWVCFISLTIILNNLITFITNIL